MADQENCVRVTRLARKRAAEEMAAQQPPRAAKKRVALGELTNSSNAPATRDRDLEPTKPKCRAKKKANKAKATTTANEIYEESEDPQMCASYASDIYKYLQCMEMEVKRRPLPDYIEKVQKDVNANMRGILVDWLVEVAEEYKLLSDTLYLSISYIDRFLSTNVLNKQRLQLLGGSSMLVASKYEEINPSRVDDFCYKTDNTFTKNEVVKMEADILNYLKFEVGSLTIN